MPAKWCLDFDMKHVYLRQVLEWRVEIDCSWSVPVGALGKGLKWQLPPAIWAAFEQTYADADIDANWTALLRTLELFRHLAVEVGDSLGCQYPEQLHARVVDYVQRIRKL